MPFVVSEVQPTPNPNAAKFILDRAVYDRPTSFFNAGAAKDHPLASKLFDIPGVSSLLLLGDFITVNKSPEADWKEISRRVQAVLAAA
jgi:NFU1 iron-sulfur cluster scaffold homolog, mitochondrial